MKGKQSRKYLNDNELVTYDLDSIQNTRRDYTRIGSGSALRTLDHCAYTVLAAMQLIEI